MSEFSSTIVMETYFEVGSRKPRCDFKVLNENGTEEMPSSTNPTYTAASTKLQGHIEYLINHQTKSWSSIIDYTNRKHNRIGEASQQLERLGSHAVATFRMDPRNAGSTIIYQGYTDSII
ncbi:uncharacterized protein L201_000932 [Kwoniella dendrophila CBS 6074]|uniref:Uncharacterized protein n=1 Tax=Kwoniella dendrophila CBS 6074 TaxID=1295534 RepID=A0AAX4JM39_9TREE